MTDKDTDALDGLTPLEFADEMETDTAYVLANVGKRVQDLIWQRAKPRLSTPPRDTDDDVVIEQAINQAISDLKAAAGLIRTQLEAIASLQAENERLKKSTCGVCGDELPPDTVTIIRCGRCAKVPANQL